MKQTALLSMVGVLAITVFVMAIANLNSPTTNTNTGASAATGGGQAGTAQIVLSKGQGSLSTSQTVNIGINPGILRQSVITDLLFAKLVVTYDSGKVTLIADPQLIATDWKNPIYAQTKAEVDQDNPGKIILVGALDEHQEPIDFQSKFAKLTFKKVNPTQTGVTEIGIDLIKSQVVNSPAQITTVTSNQLSLPL